MSIRRDDLRRYESRKRGGDFRFHLKRNRSESFWAGAMRIRQTKNDGPAQVKVLEENNIVLANTMNGLRATLDFQYSIIQNYNAKSL